MFIAPMMKHKGVCYELIPPVTPADRWKWIVHFDDATTKAGQSFLRTSAVQNAKRAINGALKVGELSATTPNAAA